MKSCNAKLLKCSWGEPKKQKRTKILEVKPTSEYCCEQLCCNIWKSIETKLLSNGKGWSNKIGGPWPFDACLVLRNRRITRAMRDGKEVWTLEVAWTKSQKVFDINLTDLKRGSADSRVKKGIKILGRFCSRTWDSRRKLRWCQGKDAKQPIHVNWWKLQVWILDIERKSESKKVEANV